MKFLLTSGGITNTTLARAVLDMLGRAAEEIKLAFVPTAANVEAGDKSWLIDDLVNFKKQGYASVDIVDIAAIPKDVWLPRLEAANVWCFGGGNEQYLARIFRESGLRELLPNLLKNRLYIGISAGSMAAGKFLPLELLEVVYEEEELKSIDREHLEPSLGLVDVYIIPHLNSPYFPRTREHILSSIKNKLYGNLYALDDQCALKVQNGNIEVIGGGQYLLI